MRPQFAALAIAGLWALASPALASGAGERYEHFKGKPSATLDEALKNFSEYNRKLEAVVGGKLNDDAMHKVHELTYTLENALEKINAELTALAETLEEVHQASERLDGDAVLRHTRKYLEVSRQVVK